MTILDNHIESCFPDTGAKHHMTLDNSKFISCKSYYGTNRIMVGNGHQFNITHIRSTTLQIRKNTKNW